MVKIEYNIDKVILNLQSYRRNNYQGIPINITLIELLKVIEPAKQ